MVARKQKWNLKKKTLQKQQKKMELAGERYPASHFTVVVGFQDKMCIRKKKPQTKRQNPPTNNNNIGLEIAKKVGM